MICLYEKIWLNKYPSQFQPVVYRGYVDDIFVLFISKEHLKFFVNDINSKHKNIKFICETENLNNFTILDVRITSKKKRFVTSIFRKASFSGFFNKYENFIFDSYKLGLVHTLLFWFFKICFNMEHFHIEIEQLKSFFQM